MSTSTSMTTTSPSTSITGPTSRRRVLSLAALALAAIVAWSFGGARPADAAPLRAAKASASSATAAAATEDGADAAPKKRTPKELSGKLNVNTASEDQLMLLPGVGPAMSDRIIGYRAKYGSFKRVADLRKVKGIGYKTLKKLEPYLDVKGDTTLTEK